MRNMWDKELSFPENVLYSPELLWVKIESDDTLRLGISDLGVKAVKKLVYIRLKARVGAQMKKGDLIGMVETTKMVWEIVAPVSGEVIAVNETFRRGNTTALETSPYGEGWILQLKKSADTQSDLAQLLPGGEEKTKQWIVERAQALVPLHQEQ